MTSELTATLIDSNKHNFFDKHDMDRGKVCLSLLLKSRKLFFKFHCCSRIQLMPSPSTSLKHFRYTQMSPFM